MTEKSATEGSATPPNACDHYYYEHSSRYDLRCSRCGQSSLDSGTGDLRMLKVWEAWARHTGNPGAASLFARIAFRIDKQESDSHAAVVRLREENTALKADAATPRITDCPLCGNPETVSANRQGEISCVQCGWKP